MVFPEALAVLGRDVTVRDGTAYIGGEEGICTLYVMKIEKRRQ